MNILIIKKLFFMENILNDKNNKNENNNIEKK